MLSSPAQDDRAPSAVAPYPLSPSTEKETLRTASLKLYSYFRTSVGSFRTAARSASTTLRSGVNWRRISSF